jgi:hypothetical protein
MSHVQISRDPLSRVITVRRLISKSERKSCAWCGRPSRFLYGTEKDGLYSKILYDDRQFCSLICRNTYYER